MGVPPLGEIAAHFTEAYGASVSKDTISRITDKVIEDMTTWSSTPIISAHVRNGHRHTSSTNLAPCSGKELTNLSHPILTHREKRPPLPRVWLTVSLGGLSTRLWANPNEPHHTGILTRVNESSPRAGILT